ncbi:hypothetical protein [Deinococcus misasensis]|uniref:hypothetical protein n=1 Tax=Deinococcus misasensis TaxID=392413 RepID=UPI0012FBFEFD|nr:hypothetical protein [Deinococcus misasensis]
MSPKFLEKSNPIALSPKSKPSFWKLSVMVGIVLILAGLLLHSQRSSPQDRSQQSVQPVQKSPAQHLTEEMQDLLANCSADLRKQTGDPDATKTEFETSSLLQGESGFRMTGKFYPAGHSESSTFLPVVCLQNQGQTETVLMGSLEADAQKPMSLTEFQGITKHAFVSTCLTAVQKQIEVQEGLKWGSFSAGSVRGQAGAYLFESRVTVTKYQDPKSVQVIPFVCMQNHPDFAALLMKTNGPQKTQNPVTQVRSSIPEVPFVASCTREVTRHFREPSKFRWQNIISHKLQKQPEGMRVTGQVEVTDSSATAKRVSFTCIQKEGVFSDVVLLDAAGKPLGGPPIEPQVLEQWAVQRKQFVEQCMQLARQQLRSPESVEFDAKTMTRASGRPGSFYWDGNMVALNAFEHKISTAFTCSQKQHQANMVIQDGAGVTTDHPITVEEWQRVQKNIFISKCWHKAISLLRHTGALRGPAVSIDHELGQPGAFKVVTHMDAMENNTDLILAHFPYTCQQAGEDVQVAFH